MKRQAAPLVAPRVALLAALLAPATAFAHGVESLGEQSHAADKPASLWGFLSNPAHAAAHVAIDEQDGWRFIESDGLADHETGAFPNRGNPNAIREQSFRFRVPLRPQAAGRVTPLGHQNFGVALNGVPFDPLTAEYWNNDRASSWNIEAMSGAMNLGLDRNNAHVQPNGAYHYHAMPTGHLEKLGAQKNGPVQLGWAADGFPIYAPFGFGAAEYKASYRIKSGVRPSGPGGAYDGTYVQDYEYAQGLGDLDECNGVTAKTAEFPNGTYLYVISTAYPFIPRCWKGAPDQSFARGPRGQGGGQGGGPGGPGMGGQGMGGPGMGGPGMGMPPPFGHRPPPR